MYDLTYFKNRETVVEFFSKMNLVKIYKGKDDCCRCGCGGTYYYKDNDEIKFNRIYRNALNAFDYLNNYGDKMTEKRFEVAFYNNEGFMNIPIYNELNPQYNQCYCIYFTKKI